MSLGFAICLIIHVIFSVLLVIGYAHEDKVIEFEDLLIAVIKNKIHNKKSKRVVNKSKQKHCINTDNGNNIQGERYIFATSLDKYDCFHAA